MSASRGRVIITLCATVLIGIAGAILHHVFGAWSLVAAGSIAAGVVGLVWIAGNEYEHHGQAECEPRRVRMRLRYALIVLAAAIGAIVALWPEVLWAMAGIYLGPLVQLFL